MSINFHRIRALTLKYFYVYTGDLWKFINSVYWVCIEILIWVNVGNWIQSGLPVDIITKYFLVSALVWMPFIRPAYDISLAVLREIHSSNLCNLFSSPLQFKEWVISLLIFSFAITSLILIFGFSFVSIFYSINVFSFYLLPLLLILFLSGASLAFLSSGLIIYFGSKVEELIYMLPWLFAPFSGVYYSLKTLAYWMQVVGSFLPMSYIFIYVHAVIEGKETSLKLVFLGCLISIIYFFLSYYFFKFMFNKSKDLGLSRLN